jgi:hypothetical protein
MNEILPKKYALEYLETKIGKVAIFIDEVEKASTFGISNSLCSFIEVALYNYREPI